MLGYQGKFLCDPQSLLFEVKGSVAWVTLNRPEKRNALSQQLTSELHDAMLEADARTDVNVVLLQGAGLDFCAGYDLAGSYAGRAEESEKLARGENLTYRSLMGSYEDDTWSMEKTQRRLIMIFDMHKPVIAKVHGNCLAGGVDLALFCDMIVAADDARIGFPATRANGSPPSHMWIYHLGPQWTKRMLMTGDVLTGRDAARLGMIMQSYPADELDEATVTLAERVALVDSELLSAHKRIVNLALEEMGAKTLQRLAVENDARSHLATGPRRQRFKADMAASGLKEALKNRDEPFGDSVIRLRD